MAKFPVRSPRHAESSICARPLAYQLDDTARCAFSVPIKANYQTAGQDADKLNVMRRIFQRMLWIFSCKGKLHFVLAALQPCQHADSTDMQHPSAHDNKRKYLCAFQCRSEIVVVCFVSCWTAAAAEPHVDHDASAVCSSPSPVNVGPTAMDAYTAQSGPLASKMEDTHMHG